MEWLLYDRDLRHGRVNVLISSGYEILLLYSCRLSGKTIIDFQHFVIWFSTCLACLRAYVPMCFVCLRAHVSTCLACLRAHCQRALRALVLTCQPVLSAYMSHVSTCLACLCTQVSTSFAISLAYVQTCLESLTWQDLNDHVITCQHALPPL